MPKNDDEKSAMRFFLYIVTVVYIIYKNMFYFQYDISIVLT